MYTVYNLNSYAEILWLQTNYFLAQVKCKNRGAKLYVGKIDSCRVLHLHGDAFDFKCVFKCMFRWLSSVIFIIHNKFSSQFVTF